MHARIQLARQTHVQRHVNAFTSLASGVRSTYQHVLHTVPCKKEAYADLRCSIDEAWHVLITEVIKHMSRQPTHVKDHVRTKRFPALQISHVTNIE